MRALEGSPADVSHIALMSPGYLPDCRTKDAVLAHIKSLHYIPQGGLPHIFFTFIPNLNPILRYFSLVFTFSVFLVDSPSILMGFSNNSFSIIN
jgi:hypothetical protein